MYVHTHTDIIVSYICKIVQKVCFVLVFIGNPSHREKDPMYLLRALRENHAKNVSNVIHQKFTNGKKTNEEEEVKYKRKEDKHIESPDFFIQTFIIIC